MASLDVLRTLINFKENFENIKTKEHFDTDPLLAYDPDDLTSYEEKRKRYFAVWPHGKKEKKNTFFEDQDKKKCNESIFNRKCFTEIKALIWILIFAAIFMSILFFIFMIYKVFFAHSEPHKSSASGQLQQTYKPSQPSQVTQSAQPTQPMQHTQQLQPPDSSDDSSFLKKLLKTKSVAPDVQGPQDSLNPPHNFFDRLIGSKPAPIPSQAPPPPPKNGDFMSRFIETKSQ